MDWAPSRRRVLAGLSASAAGLIGGTHGFAQEAPPEITTIRLTKIPGICVAPQYVAEELLKAEGFSDVQYVEVEAAGGRKGRCFHGVRRAVHHAG